MMKQLAKSFVLVLALVGVAAAQSGSDSRAEGAGEDWVSLFNGTDLSGWVKVGNEQWSVEDGVIHGVAVTKEYGYLMTEKHYRDFHLSLRFLCEGDGNSGVFFHTAVQARHRRRVAGAAVRDRLHHHAAHRRHLRRRPQLDRVARP